jgi:hypothetical protein
VFFVTFVVHVIFVLLAAVPAGAQTNQQILQGGSPLPPRDARLSTPTATGTATIRGRVFAADSGRPLRRARIQINGPGLPGAASQTVTLKLVSPQ